VAMPIKSLTENFLLPFAARARRFFVFLARVFRSFSENYCFNMSAEIAFYFLLALVPFLIFIIGFSSACSSDVMARTTVHAMISFLPEKLYRMAEPTVADIIYRPRYIMTLTTMIVSLWAVAQSVLALLMAFERIHSSRHHRTFFGHRRVALLMTLAIISLLVFTLYSLVLLPAFAKRYLPAMAYKPWYFSFKWGLASLIIAGCAELIYRYGPPDRAPRAFVTPGAIAALVMIVASTLGFKLYLEHFGEFNALYGAMGGFMVLMLWLYMLGASMLFGAQMNYEYYFCDVKNGAAR